MTTVLCVPQWQGSSAPGAKRLMVGARRTAEYLAGAAAVEVPVLEGDGERAAGVRRLDALVENFRRTRDALRRIDDVVVTAGGDCGVELAPVAAARARYGDRLTVLWIDAHPDVSTTETLPSGSFHGMVLRTLLGEGPAPLTPDEPLTPEQVILAGVRSYEAGQREYIEHAGIRSHPIAGIGRALAGLSGPVYVHVDLDVLDPSEFDSVCYSEPGGVTLRELVDLVSGVDDVVGASLTEHAPSEDADVDRDADAIRRLGAALRRGA